MIRLGMRPTKGSAKFNSRHTLLDPAGYETADAAGSGSGSGNERGTYCEVN